MSGPDDRSENYSLNVPFTRMDDNRAPCCSEGTAEYISYWQHYRNGDCICVDNYYISVIKHGI